VVGIIAPKAEGYLTWFKPGVDEFTGTSRLLPKPSLQTHRFDNWKRSALEQRLCGA